MNRDSSNQCLQPPNRWPVVRTGLVSAALALLVVAVHWPALSARAVSFDDNQYLHDNYLVQHPGWATARRFLAEVLEPSTVGGYYQPLAMISLMLDTAMGGRPDNLRPYHRTSLALHAINVVLVFLLIRGLLGRDGIATAVALLFGIHPMTVEPIPWVGERKTLLAACFSLLVIIAYVRYARATDARDAARTGNPQRRGRHGPKSADPQLHKPPRRVIWYAATAALLTLALMSKPTATPLPLLLLVLDYWPLERWRRQNARSPKGRLIALVLEKLPLLAISGVFAVITVTSQARTAAVGLPGDPGTAHVLLVLGYFGPFYLSKAAFPLELSTHYPIPQPFSFSNPTLVLTMIATLLLIVSLAYSLRWTRAFVAGAAFFVIAVLPTTGLLAFTNVIASDKYAYLPVVGPLLTLAWLIGRLARAPRHAAGDSRKRQWVLIGGFIVIALTETTLTRRQLAYWQTTERLYAHMLELAPRAWQLHEGLGSYYAGTGDWERALISYRRGYELRPSAAGLNYNIGNVYLRSGRPQEALAWYERALQLTETSDTHNNLGHALTQLNRLPEAFPHYERALQLRPKNTGARNNLAVALAKSGHFDEAIAQFQAVLDLAPENPRAWGNLGSAILESGRPVEAISYFERATRLDPKYVEVWMNWGEALMQLERFREAAEKYGLAAQLRPDNAQIRERLQELATRGSP